MPETTLEKKTAPSEAISQQRLVRLVDTLQTIEWAMDNFGSLITNRQLRPRDLEKPIEMGLVTSVGMVEQCDDDGCVIEGRVMREGFILTEDGFDFLKANDQIHPSR